MNVNKSTVVLSLLAIAVAVVLSFICVFMKKDAPKIVHSDCKYDVINGTALSTAVPETSEDLIVSNDPIFETELSVSLSS